MARPRALITARFDPGIASSLEQVAEAELRNWEEGRLDTDALASALAGVQILVTEIDQVDEALLRQCPDLRAVITCRGSPVNIDVEACTARGVAVLNTPGRNARGVADLAVGFILACERQIVSASVLLHEGGWTRGDRRELYRRFSARDMDEVTVGLVGFGAVGRALARRLRGFGTRVLVFDPYIPQEVFAEHDVVRSDLDVLLAESDFVSLHVHVTPETRHMIGARELGLMKPTAYLINTGRSGAADQEAMQAALQEGRLAGAALDVYDEEPLPVDSPLRALDNVILTPHIGGATTGPIRVQSEIVREQITAMVQGKEPPHLLNAEAGVAALSELRG